MTTPEKGPPPEPGIVHKTRYVGRAPLVPEVLSGCRKAPIMALGINPNLPGWWPHQRRSLNPLFDDYKQYAHYFRYCALAKLELSEEDYRAYGGGDHDPARRHGARCAGDLRAPHHRGPDEVRSRACPSGGATGGGGAERAPAPQRRHRSPAAPGRLMRVLSDARDRSCDYEGELRPLSAQPQLTADSAVAALNVEKRTQEDLLDQLPQSMSPVADAWAQTDELSTPEELP